jgi:hypothetical protein
MHAQLFDTLKKLVASEDGMIALTMDCWTSATERGYLGKWTTSLRLLGSITT